VDLVLLDWTRMGHSYCLAGALVQGDQVRVVRPLLARNRQAPVRNVGWSPFLMDGRSRWELFELVRPQAAEPQPPHLEDVWVQSLQPRRRLAEPALRRAILQATQAPPEQPLFGVPLKTTRTAAFLSPSEGVRSLATVVVPAREVSFSVAWRDGCAGPDFRVSLPVPGFAPRILPLKDHFLLRQAETASTNPDGQVRTLQYALRQLGDQVAVRLGLSRPYSATGGAAEGACWLMADGFFSFSDPQP
jgi:hypothetical protein